MNNFAVFYIYFKKQQEIIVFQQENMSKRRL